jgi:hypothetical protein
MRIVSSATEARRAAPRTAARASLHLANGFAAMHAWPADALICRLSLHLFPRHIERLAPVICMTVAVEGM